MNVQLNDSTPGTTILVSNNGQPPSATNIAYSNNPVSLTVSQQTTLEAVACLPNQGLCSAITSATYTCASPPPVPTYDTIEIQGQTGWNVANRNLRITASVPGQRGSLCLKPSRSAIFAENILYIKTVL
jgi:hypothetical protein